MRKILITAEIKRLAEDYATKMETGACFQAGKSPKERLEKLSRQLRLASANIKILQAKAKKGHPAKYIRYGGNKYTDVSDYVQEIYCNYDGLNKLLPSEYHQAIVSRMEGLIDVDLLSKISVKLPKKRWMTLSDCIVDAMQYSKVQSDIMPEYIRKIGIKTCVYCNAQFATTSCVQKITSAPKGKYMVKEDPITCYDLDHNMPKSKYPYLCTNFYNLQPTCSSCNRRKGNRELGFSLYYESDMDDPRPLHFALDHRDITRFRTTNDYRNIKVYLCNTGQGTPPSIADTTSLAGEFNSKLGVQAIYDEYSDIVEEILWNHKIYSNGLMTALAKQLPSLGLNQFSIKRFILGGFYEKETDFLKRPFSVMKEDIWEQLKKK